MSVLVLGSANMDLVAHAARAPRAGETVTGTDFALGLGGKGLNQAVAAARCGASVAFVGRVGADGHGRALREGLSAAGVDVTGLVDDPSHASGVAVIVVSDDGDNRILVVPGANGAVGADELARLTARLHRGCVLVVQLEVPMSAVEEAVSAAGQRGVRAVVDPAPGPDQGLPDALYAAHVILTPNEGEAELLVGHPLDTAPLAERAARTLVARGAGAVAVKLGERGVCWVEGDRLGWQPAGRVAVRDTVGAGDAVNGALAVALHEGLPFPEAVRWGVAAGAVAVTRSGAFDAMPRRDEVLAQLERLDGTRLVGAPAD